MQGNPLFAKQNNNVAAPEKIETVETYGLKVLIIDDETEVHRVTDLTLKRFRFSGKKIKFLHAYSAAEAKEIFLAEADIALALVDVVMETEHAGLDLVHWVRKELKNHECRLILRTGQPGQAPEHEVIEKYDINDYKEKTELTSQKLKTLMYSGLRSYHDIHRIEEHRKGLRQVIESTGKMLESNSMAAFASAVLKEVMNILNLQSSAVYCSTVPNDNVMGAGKVLAATGDLTRNINSDDMSVLPEAVKAQFDLVIKEKKSFYSDGGYVFYTQTENGYENVLYIDTQGPLLEDHREFLEIYCLNVSLVYENLLIAEEILDTQKELVYLLGDTVETRSKETGNHVLRVSLISQKLAEHYGVNEKEAILIKRASLLHDLGNMVMPESDLADKLSTDEVSNRQEHAMIGYDILKNSRNPVLRKAAEINLTYHEKWDGSGYPKQLAGETIPIAGRIIAIADIFDALGSTYFYKEPWDKEAIKAFLLQQKGKHFDPKLVDILVDNFNEFWEIRTYYPDGGAS